MARLVYPEARLDREVASFFIGLGYDVSWDSRRRQGDEWHEISLDGDLVAQIDTGVPLADIIEDLSAMADGKPGTSKTDYLINAPDDEPFDTLCRKVKKAGKKLLTSGPLAGKV